MTVAILKFTTLPFGVDEHDTKTVPWYYTPNSGDHALNLLNCLNRPFGLGPYEDPFNMLRELRCATMLEF